MAQKNFKVIEVIQMLETSYNFTQKEKQDFEKMNGRTVEECAKEIEEGCLYIDNYSLSQMRELKKVLKQDVSKELVKAIEEVNKKSIEEVKQHIDKVIAEKNDLTRRKKEFNRRWNELEPKIEMELIEAGIVVYESGCKQIVDICAYRRKRLEEQAKIAKDLNLDYEVYDSLAGKIEI